MRPPGRAHVSGRIPRSASGYGPPRGGGISTERVRSILDGLGVGRAVGGGVVKRRRLNLGSGKAAKCHSGGRTTAARTPSRTPGPRQTAGGAVVPIITGVYENGVFRRTTPVNLPEGSTV